MLDPITLHTIQLIDASLFLKGGSGSGNWGHRGRKGKRGGSAPSRAGVGVGKRGAVQNALDTVHAHSLATNKEQLIVLDKNGKTEWTSSDIGGRHEVSEIELTKDSRILVHSHPAPEKNFTSTDVDTFLKTSQLEQSLVIDNRGTVYQITRTDQTKPYESSVWMEMNKLYSSAYPEEAVFDEKISHREGKAIAEHAAMQSLAKSHGFSYSREKVA